MKTLNIGDKEYVLEFSFQAAKHKQLINKMFKMLSGSYLGRSGLTGAEDETKADRASALIDGVADMYAEMPDTVITAFYAGLMENNAVMNEAEAGKLLKQYFKDSHDESATFPGMFDLIKECMQDEWFFQTDRPGQDAGEPGSCNGGRGSGDSRGSACSSVKPARPGRTARRNRLLQNN